VLSGLESPQAIAADDQSAPFIALADGAVHGGVGLKLASRPEILARVKREAILTCPLIFAIWTACPRKEIQNSNGKRQIGFYLLFSPLAPTSASCGPEAEEEAVVLSG
jgi:hypothetical protein